MGKIETRTCFVPVGSGCPPLQRRGPAVLVVAPHPDDDVLGAGGAMALAARAGTGVYALYVSACGTALRRAEALAALEAVGAQGAFFAGFSARSLRSRPARAIVCLREVFRAVAAGAVYLPTPFERHPTHRSVTGLSLRALRGITGYVPRLWGYSVWNGLQVPGMSRTLDITDVIGLNLRAVAQHRSQLRCKPYAGGMAAKNRYDGVYAHTHGRTCCTYAEVFLDMAGLLERGVGMKGFCRRVALRCAGLEDRT